MAEEQNNTRAGGAPSRLARVPEGRVLAGVCSGLGRHTGIDPVVYRVGFGILVLAHGQGILLYVAAALVMPAEPNGAAVLERLFKRRFDVPGVLSILAALLCVAVALSMVGAGMVGTSVSTDAFAVLTVFGLVLLTAHARGVDLAAAARSLPERFQGYPPEPRPEPRTVPVDSPVSLDKGASGTGGGDGGLPAGMIDLAALSRRSEDREPADTRRAPAEARKGDVPAEACRGGRPALTSITLLGAMAAAAAAWPMARTHPGPEAGMIMTACALAVVGCGLMAGGWFRSRGLATTGTVLTCALLTTSVAAEAPRDARYGEVEWRPVDATPTQQDYRVAAGTGRLDLTALPLKPGQRVTVNAHIAFGELDVRVPRAARVEVDARVGLGDLDMAGRTISGPGARADQVLEAEGPGAKNPPVITLRIRGRMSDVRVTRA